MQSPSIAERTREKPSIPETCTLSETNIAPENRPSPKLNTSSKHPFSNGGKKYQGRSSSPSKKVDVFGVSPVPPWRRSPCSVLRPAVRTTAGKPNEAQLWPQQKHVGSEYAWTASNQKKDTNQSCVFFYRLVSCWGGEQLSLKKCIQLMEGWMWINEEKVAFALLLFPIRSSNPPPNTWVVHHKNSFDSRVKKGVSKLNKSLRSKKT